jgi:hypothetical protein
VASPSFWPVSPANWVACVVLCSGTAEWAFPACVSLNSFVSRVMISPLINVLIGHWLASAFRRCQS